MKYNTKEIMTRAWEFFRKGMGDFSTCLKKAWANAKAILAAKLASGVKEETHTWYAWKMLGFEVIHESVALFKCVVNDATTKSGTRILSYFGASQVAPIVA